MNGAYRAAVDSPARLCKRVIKGQQQRVLPPPVYHKRSPSTMYKPLRKGGISMTCTEEHKEHIEYTFHPLGTTDEYFKAPEPDEEYIVHLCGDTVILNNGLLVQALSRLPVEEQEMLYLSFYRRISREKIGKLYGRSRSATGRHIRKSIQRLYEEMEGMAYEE